MRHPTLEIRNCPECAAPMRPARVQSHYGQPFVVEQCPRCGGLWFDAREHHRLHQDIVTLIDPVDDRTLAQPSAPPKIRICPKDHTHLTRFRDQNFPNTILIEMCPTCTGLWFNKGEYATYRNHVTQRRADSNTSNQTKVQKLAKAFLMLNDIRADRAHIKEAEHAFAREWLISLLSFLYTRSHTPVAVWLAILGPIVAMLQTLSDSQADRTLYVDMQEFQTMLQSIQHKERSSSQTM